MCIYICNACPRAAHEHQSAPFPQRQTGTAAVVKRSSSAAQRVEEGHHIGRQREEQQHHKGRQKSST